MLCSTRGAEPYRVQAGESGVGIAVLRSKVVQVVGSSEETEMLLMVHIITSIACHTRNNHLTQLFKCLAFTRSRVSQGVYRLHAFSLLRDDRFPLRGSV